MHDLQTIIKQNNQPVSQRTPPAVIKEQQVRAAAKSEKVPALDRVVYGPTKGF